MKQYFGLSEFFDDYEERENTRRPAPIHQVDQLIERLRAEGYSVRELKDGRIIVRSPEEIKTSLDKRKALQAQSASKYSKLGASFPKEITKQFADACRALGCTQSEALMAAIECTINRANEIE